MMNGPRRWAVVLSCASVLAVGGVMLDTTHAPTEPRVVDMTQKPAMDAPATHDVVTISDGAGTIYVKEVYGNGRLVSCGPCDPLHKIGSPLQHGPSRDPHTVGIDTVGWKWAPPPAGAGPNGERLASLQFQHGTGDLWPGSCTLFGDCLVDVTYTQQMTFNWAWGFAVGGIYGDAYHDGCSLVWCAGWGTGLQDGLHNNPYGHNAAWYDTCDVIICHHVYQDFFFYTVARPGLNSGVEYCCNRWMWGLLIGNADGSFYYDYGVDSPGNQQCVWAFC